MKGLNIIASEIIKKFDSVKLEWIEREKNSKADELASKTLGYIEDPYHYKIIRKKDNGVGSSPIVNKNSHQTNLSSFSSNSGTLSNFLELINNSETLPNADSADFFCPKCKLNVDLNGKLSKMERATSGKVVRFMDI